MNRTVYCVTSKNVSLSPPPSCFSCCLCNDPFVKAFTQSIFSQLKYVKFLNAKTIVWPLEGHTVDQSREHSLTS